MTINIQELIKKEIKSFYLLISSEQNYKELLNNLDKTKFFVNSEKFVSRNEYELSRGSIKYLEVDLVSKIIKFSRFSLKKEEAKEKLFIDGSAGFTTIGFKLAGPKLKLNF